MSVPGKGPTKILIRCGKENLQKSKNQLNYCHQALGLKLYFRKYFQGKVTFSSSFSKRIKWSRRLIASAKTLPIQMVSPWILEGFFPRDSWICCSRSRSQITKLELTVYYPEKRLCWKSGSENRNQWFYLNLLKNRKNPVGYVRKVKPLKRALAGNE